MILSESAITFKQFVPALSIFLHSFITLCYCEKGSLPYLKSLHFSTRKLLVIHRLLHLLIHPFTHPFTLKGKANFFISLTNNCCKDEDTDEVADNSEDVPVNNNAVITQ